MFTLIMKSEAIDWVAREEERPGVVAEQLEQVEIFYRKSIHTLTSHLLNKHMYLQKVNTLAVTAFQHRSKKRVPGHRNKN